MCFFVKTSGCKISITVATALGSINNAPNTTSSVSKSLGGILPPIISIGSRILVLLVRFY